MRKPSMGIIIYGWIEILTLLIAVVTLLHIEKFPIVLIFLSPPISVLGIFTIRLSSFARRLNILLSPLIVFTYSSGFMILIEYISSILNLSIDLNMWHFSFLFTIFLILHLFFFSRPKVREQFEVKQ